MSAKEFLEGKIGKYNSANQSIMCDYEDIENWLTEYKEQPAPASSVTADEMDKELIQQIQNFLNK